MNLDFDNQTDQEIEISRLEEIAASLTDKDIELVITGNEQIRELNKEHRGKDKPTDVLSFPYEPISGFPLGSIVISIDLVKEKAKEYGHTFDEELALLFIHGLLHLLGYDHEIDKGEHREKEEELIEKFALPKSLIVRNT